MTCFLPKKAWLPSDGGRPEFKEPIGSAAGEYMQIGLNCRKCIGCRKSHARDWGLRCWHESRLHEWSTAITLTYDDEHLPEGGGLQPRDVELWLKRIRFAVQPDKLRFFEAGEFGERRHRPHYHVILFGAAFPDRKYHGMSKAGFRLYESQLLTETWGNGLAVFNDLTLESAMYAAQYALKKVGAKSTTDYKRTQQEFCRMSRRPGIGYGFLEKFHGDIFRRDWCGVVTPGGQVFPVPDYYLRVLREWCEQDYLDVKERRAAEAALRFAENQPDRLAVRAECAEAALRFGSRKSAPRSANAELIA